LSENFTSERDDRDHLELACSYVLRALSATEIAAFEAHLSTCLECRQEVGALRRIVDSFESWPIDVLRPSASLWERLSRRIADESGGEPVSPPRVQTTTQWEKAGDGIFFRLLSIDARKDRFTALVRLEPGAEYPAHRHSELEEAYMLHGELRVDDKKYCAGDYFRAEAGSVDHRVWSDTGCTCVLITSMKDALL
jgi:quercetin dioxygenase-like cupin family protein